MKKGPAVAELNPDSGVQLIAGGPKVIGGHKLDTICLSASALPTLLNPHSESIGALGDLIENSQYLVHLLLLVGSEGVIGYDLVQ